MLRPAPAPVLLAALALATGACMTPRASITRRPATPAERTAVVECAAAVVTDEGFAVTERRPDIGLLSATTPSDDADVTAAAGPAPKGGGDLASGAPDEPVDLLTVSIAKHPLHEGISLLVRASTRVGATPVAPSPKAAVARDRILRSCTYLVG